MSAHGVCRLRSTAKTDCRFPRRRTMSRLETLPELPGSGSAAIKPAKGLSIGQYLIRRLQDYGIRDAFGIPGDYILGFYAQLSKSPIRIVGCTREDCAG